MDRFKSIEGLAIAVLAARAQACAAKQGLRLD